MAASRASSIRTLSKLAASSVPRNTRSLHMTGPATFPSPLLTTEKPSFNKVQAAISDAASRTDSESHGPSMSSARKFNTSRSLKAVHDTSTIDFAYLPDLDPDAGNPAPPLRVPLLPESLYPQSTKSKYTTEEEEIVTMRPEINLVAADGTHVSPPSAFADVVDNNTVDFQGVTDTLAEAGKVVEEDLGTVKKVWNDLLDDLMGSKKT